MLFLSPRIYLFPRAFGTSSYFWEIPGAGRAQCGVWERRFTISTRSRAGLVNRGDECPAVSILQRLWSSGMSLQGGNLTAFPREEGTWLALGSGTSPWTGWDVAVSSIDLILQPPPSAPTCKKRIYPQGEFGTGPAAALETAPPPSPGPAGGELWSDCPGGSAKRGLRVMNYSHGCH